MTADTTAILDPITASWIEDARKIPSEIAARYGVVTINGCPAFEYRSNGRLNYRKIRITGPDGEKSFRRDRKEAETCLFGEQEIQDEPVLSSPLVVCEGELDRLSLLAAGVVNVVSVPDGAQLRDPGEGKIDPTDDKAFGWLWDGASLKPHLKQFSRVVLATDSDRPGKILREELAVRLDRSKCFYVEYPDGCKDANDVLIAHGPAALAEIIAKARPIVPDRLVPISDIIDTTGGEVFSSGLQGLDEGLKFSWMPPELCVITGSPGSGKALALGTAIPTPAGWTTMGDIKVGDTVYGADGKPCRVINATDVMLGHECFEIEFSDGAKVIADADHQWFTSTDKARKSSQRAAVRSPVLRPKGTDQTHKRNSFPSVVTTRVIAETLRRGDGGNNHSIELCAPVAGVHSILPIEPYVLGVWLGNGRNADAGVCLHEEAQSVEFRRAANGLDIRQWSDGSTLSIIGMKVKLDALGVIHDKHIPRAYLGASVPQRKALLQGLMDTDGYCNPESRLCEYTSVDISLGRDVWELACSLGLKATFNVGRAQLNGRDMGPKYRIVFTAPDFPVFRLERKASKQKIGQKNRTGRRYIVGCKPVDSVPVRCIQVDSADHLFLVTRNFIPTHNSELATVLGANLARYHQLPGAILQFEDRSSRVRDTLIRYALGHGVCNTRSEAREWTGKWFRTIEPVQSLDDLVEHDLTWLRETLTEARLRHGCRWVILDPWNELEHMWDRSKSEAQYTNDALRALKAIARALNIILMIVVHPSKEGGRMKDITELDMYSIAGAAAWANKADHGFIVARPDHSKPEAYVKLAKSKDHSNMGSPGIVRMTYVPSQSKYRYVGMGV